ncbi:glycosyltransferase family 4 protein [Sphingobacterium sp. NGMCC 1.201703]|uniref:glycosyltransferase family 4 protein n=1 Tax=Sphingobacterium sp. NGMCC 1.201703 TaxID=3388657 RepID=UPI0039FC8E95
MENKNIAFYLGDFKRSGGTERSCIAVANELAMSSKHNVFVIVTNKESENPFFEINQNVSIIYLEIENCKREYFSLSKRLKTALKKYQIDILVAVEIMSILFLMPIFLAKKMGLSKIKLFVWEHFNFTVSLNRKLRTYLRKFAANFADVIIVLTQKDIQLWKDKLNVKAKMISISNPSPFSVSNQKYNELSRNVIAVGRLTYQKGFDRLLDIWSEFIQRSPASDWKLQIIGSGSDESKLKEQAEKLKISQSVEWISNTPNVKAFYENASFLAMTSRFEGLPMTLIEAQSFGLPIIAYNCLTGPAEVITEESGILIDDGRQSEFVNGLLMMSTDTSKRITMSQFAKTELERFTPSAVNKKWNDLISGI